MNEKVQTSDKRNQSLIVCVCLYAFVYMLPPSMVVIMAVIMSVLLYVERGRNIIDPLFVMYTVVFLYTAVTTAVIFVQAFLRRS